MSNAQEQSETEVNDIKENIVATQESETDLEKVEVDIKSATLAENITLQNVTERSNSSKYVSCTPKFGSSEVQLVNDTELINLLAPDGNITSRDMPGNCVTVLFYSKYCPFSSLAAPHFNALPRAFPDIKMVAINAMMYHLFNAQNGIVGVPSLLLFHSGRPVAKYNESEYTLEQFSRFLTKNTGINAEEKSYVTSADFSGPVCSVPAKETDLFLGLSWAFIVICAIYYFTKSKWWKWIVETIQNNWRESEAQAQHEHNE